MAADHAALSRSARSAFTAGALLPLDLGVELKEVDGGLTIRTGLEAVHADDDSLARVDGLLGAIRRFLNFSLNEAGFDRGERAPHAVNPLEDGDGASLDFVGQAFDFIRTGDWIDGVRDTGLRRDQLLCAKCEARRIFGGKAKRFVAAVAVQRLRPSQDGGHRLNRHTHDVVIRLLRGQRAAGCLGVKAQLLRARIRGAKAVAHQARPETTGGAELRDLLEEIVVCVEEEREPLAELIHLEPSVDRRLDVGQAVREREGDLLHGCRTRLRGCDTR